MICALFGWACLLTSSPESLAASAEADTLPLAEFAHGRIGVDRWSAGATVPEEAQERDEGNVCLSLFVLEVWLQEERAQGSEGTQCGPLDAHEVMYESYTVHRRTKKPHTAVAFLFDGSAVRIDLKLEGQPAQRIRLRHLPPQPGTSGRRLAYFAHGYARLFCLQGLMAFDAAGKRIAHLGPQGC